MLASACLLQANILIINAKIYICNKAQTYKTNGACQLHIEEKIGSLETGKEADLISLGKDPSRREQTRSTLLKSCKHL